MNFCTARKLKQPKLLSGRHFFVGSLCNSGACARGENGGQESECTQELEALGSKILREHGLAVLVAGEAANGGTDEFIGRDLSIERVPEGN
jgi:hypothetical protein